MATLEEREAKRKQSIVKAIISDKQENEQPDHIENSRGENLFVIPKEKEEIRSKRVNLLIKPSVYEKAQKKCKKMGISLNECMNQLLDNWSQNQSQK